MSRFITRLKQVAQGASRPMGFKASNDALSWMKMLLVAGLAEAGPDKLPDYVAGADAGLIVTSEAGSGAKTIKEATQAVSGIPWGSRLEGVGTDEIDQIAKAGGDFLVLTAASGVLPELQGSTVGLVLEVDISLEEGLLAAVNKLPVDAVLVTSEPPEGAFLNWYRLMRLRRCADLLAKPLLVSIPSDLAASGLRALWDAGVDGVVVEVGAKPPAGGLLELRQAIDDMPPTTIRTRGKTAALLPYSTPGMDREAEEPDEE
ncbi:MAG TPA: hypothetical protein G4O09_04885 [Dehalococcoidia bacterium]|nr:hypothetical protein [Dehalococcoidia bacterium]